jgi:two-component system, cell cycle sensor histidine kinase and response regulator CckA
METPHCPSYPRRVALKRGAGTSPPPDDPGEIAARRLHVLLVEDDESDAFLVVAELEKCAAQVSWERVETREAMTEALERSPFDLVVADYRLPHFRAPEALALCKARGLDIPFFVVSGTIGEEQAVEVLKAGAHDFFLKGRLSRLCAAIERELREVEARRALRHSESGREAAIESLRQSERLFHDLFESAPDATVIADAHGFICAASRQAEELFGYPPGELAGQSAEILVAPSLRPEYRRLRAGFAEAPERRLMGAGQQNLLAVRNDGSTFPIEISLSPTTTERGVVIAAIRDITDRRRLEQHLRQIQKMEAVGRLAGGVAHDFNNILGIILGQSQIMLRDLPPDHPTRSRLEQIRSASERAAGLTRQLLAFSRTQSFETQILSLNDIVEGLKGMLSRLLGEDLELTFTPGESLGRVRADPSQMEQILMNLAVNARDAMPDGGRLAIATSNADMGERWARVHGGAKEGRYVCLAVSDTGHGMTREVQERIFEPFFTTKEPGKGTGLGLATVYSIVKHCEGFVYLYSEPGQGTTFKIYVPRVDQQADAPVEQAVATRGTETVLLVEDAESLRELICELLQANGYEVLTAGEPSQALETVARHEGTIHLLLTDVVMPGMNGRELAQRVKEQLPDIRVLYMSGYTEEAIAHRGVLETGALLISKPFSQESLTRKIRQALGRGPEAAPS